ncbi:helix-turn-helix transcriptional regulator [Thermobifida halotolerans]|uniref:Helix-turn-helix transcriptional regulator n=1 Tax=Thermobifida halotolerans TaxID=483545 RepID=A0AA97M0Q7_9ACTN|nr:helix-turn-helix transcriptional regulator [Thermobifida halotolerans]UOE21680.1 helix-turn-helix transcriptional regulator [Thermobifida halotolerans]
MTAERPLATRAAIEAAITVRELNPDHPVLPAEFWTHPAVAQAVARLDITALLRRIRALTPMTQEQIARLTGTTQATISRIEHGRTQPRDLDRVRAFLTGLGAPTPETARANPLDGYTVRAVIAEDPDGHTVVLHVPAPALTSALSYTEPREPVPLPPPPTHPDWPPPR